MAPSSAEERAHKVLKTLGLRPATRAGSGRYQRSEPIRPGVRYWSTSQPRRRQDFFGVQFFGQALSDAETAAARLERAGFTRRTPQTGQLTFARPVDFGPGGELDTVGLSTARQDLDEIILTGRSTARDAGSGLAFREFMLSSPWADTELELPERKGGWRPVDI
jgi:hypothetical protein